MRPAVLLATVSTLTLATACASTPAGTGGDDDAVVDATGGDVDARPELPAFHRCVGRPYTPPAAAGFATTSGGLVAASGAPVHFGEDAIAAPGSTPHLVAHFTYGSLGLALADEPVAVSIDDCAGWQSLGTPLTDASAVVDVPVPLPLGPGVYEARFAVLGDASTTVGYLWLLPAGTHLAVSDIDGTLTTSDTELWLQILNGSYVPAAYPSAEALTTTHADKGHVVVYLTGRPTNLTGKTREWLTALGFALGPVRLAPSLAETMPTDAGVGTYKMNFLADLVGRGYLLDLAYGNATTDIFAYSGAGVPATQQWIIGTNGGASGTNAVADSWDARVGEVAALAPVVQPFAY